jgi:hypothetical protein
VLLPAISQGWHILQEQVNVCYIGLFEHTNLCTIHAKRVTIMTICFSGIYRVILGIIADDEQQHAAVSATAASTIYIYSGQQK